MPTPFVTLSNPSLYGPNGLSSSWMSGPSIPTVQAAQPSISGLPVRAINPSANYGYLTNYGAPAAESALSALPSAPYGPPSPGLPPGAAASTLETEASLAANAGKLGKFAKFKGAMSGPVGAAMVGIPLGDAISGSGWGNEWVNAGRGQSSNPIAQAAGWLGPVGAIHGGLEIASHSPIGAVSDWATEKLNNRTNDTFFGLFGGDSAPTGPDLTAPAIQAKVDALGLSPDSRAAFVSQYNQAIQDRVAAGMPVEQAAAQVHAGFFGAVNDKGEYTPGLASQFKAQELQAQEQSRKAVAMQALMAQQGGQALGGILNTADTYNGMMNAVTPTLPAWMQPIANLQQGTFNADQANLARSTYDFYQGIPARQQEADAQKLMAAALARQQSQDLAAAMPSQSSSGGATVQSLSGG